MGLFDWVGDLFGGGGDKETVTRNDYQMAPEFSEAAAARGNWWDTLQKWQTQPGYGAISPDWHNIWENARSKVQRYFGGGPEGPGVNAKVKSNLARRGMSEQPANETLLQRSDFQQGNMLQDLAIKQAIEEARLGESGRKDWLSSLMSLSSQKPTILNYGTTTNQTTAPPNALTGAGSALFSNFGGEGGLTDFLNPIMDIFGMGGGGDTGIGDVMGGGGEDEKDFFSDPQTYQMLAQLGMMFI